ncbi:hypothetical protein [Aquisphaera insulae]|uniref:hypothetical protein n=1 Tax=Aquisphaera insulae TaxID=2712864 RepID=UPI0013EBE54C|nr:hypothetical protein [Aquisphaera insulae]
MDTTTLSETAVAVLRFEVKGYRSRDPRGRQQAYRELEAAGIMEPVPGGPGYRLTSAAFERRHELLAEAEDRIERNRLEPPDVSGLTEGARRLMGRITSGERVEITDSNRSLFRELASSRVIDLMSTFTRGGESAFRFTYWGWHLRHELVRSAGANESTWQGIRR